ncbi:hypothetical protein ABBQ32_011625 [Trebouxia sp. C0010 RCD-2024]
MLRGSSKSQSKDSAGASFSLWGVAASLADTVKRNTAEITTGLKETNWRAELEAFGKGVREEEHQLRKETVKRVEVAKEHLPKDATAQLDVKRKELTSHLQKMGVGLGGLGKTLVTRTTDLFDQVRDTVVEELSASDKKRGRVHKPGSRPPSTGKYSRLEADISSMQRDSATYCDEPADTADYHTWRSNFDLANYQPAVEDLITNNAFMAELQARIVPVIVEYDAFWTRYFYRLHLLEARHLQRLEVAQRVSRVQQEEELGWDDAEADDQPQPQQPSGPVLPKNKSKQPSQVESQLPASSQGAAVPDAGDAVEGSNGEVGALAPSMQALPEEHEVRLGSSQAERQAEQRQEGRDTAIGSHSKEDHRTAGTAGDDDAADTVTSSDSGSGNEHWTVVKSPSKQSGGEGPNALTETEPSTVNVARGASTADQSKPGMSPPAAAPSSAVSQADDSSEIDELDDVSNGDDPDGNPGPEAEGDWGAWE